MIQKIILTAIDEPLFNAWESECGSLNYVETYRGSIFDLEADAVVSPANSFGFMDGGIDQAYTDFFGHRVQTFLQELIKAKHNGRLLVGDAELVPTGNDQFPYVISAPTMPTPEFLDHSSINAYLAARAALLCAKNHGFIRTVAFPGLGTGIGRMHPQRCARQVAQAIKDVLLGEWKFPTNLSQVIGHELQLWQI